MLRSPDEAEAKGIAPGYLGGPFTVQRHGRVVVSTTGGASDCRVRDGVRETAGSVADSVTLVFEFRYQT